MSYGWRDDTRVEDTPKEGGFDYKSARKAYEKEDIEVTTSKPRREDRSKYDFSGSKGKTPHPKDRVPSVNVKSDIAHPIVICVDHTGSFEEEVKMILTKLPLLGKEVERYIPDYNICFTLIGDAISDHQPIQVRDFDHGEALDTHVKELYPEGWGGDASESYDLAAYYFTHHCDMPNAIKPIFIWVLDNKTRKRLESQHILEYLGDTVQSDLDSVSVLKDLSLKFTVYVVLKGTICRDFWAEIYDDQYIIPLEDPSDIIEMFIGIIAGEVGKYEDFEMRSKSRHTDRPDRVSRVMKSTKSLKDKSSPDGGMKAESVSRGSKKTMVSKKLV